MYKKGELQFDEKDELVFLDHSCDEWWIGGPFEVRAMIEDLQEVLKRFEMKK